MHNLGIQTYCIRICSLIRSPDDLYTCCTLSKVHASFPPLSCARYPNTAGHWPSYTLSAIFIPLKPHWNHSATVNTFSVCVPCPIIMPTEEKPQPRMNPPICLSQACHGGFQAQLENGTSLQTDSTSFLRHWVHRLHQNGTADHPTPTLPTCLLLRLHLSPPPELLEVNAYPLASTLDYTLPPYAEAYVTISSVPYLNVQIQGSQDLDLYPVFYTQLHLTPSPLLTNQKRICTWFIFLPRIHPTVQNWLLSPQLPWGPNYLFVAKPHI